MSVHIHLMGAGQMADAALRAEVMSLAEGVVAELEARLTLAPLDIALFPTPNLMDARWFRSGICHSGYAVECCFNPDHPLFHAGFRTELRRILIHECHHAVRMRQVDRWTVGENLVLEGLALTAEADCGLPPEDFPPPPDEAVTPLLERAARDWDNSMGPEDDIAAFDWIWKSHSPEHVANMYHIGREIVGRALKSGGQDAFSSVAQPRSWCLEHAQGSA